MEGEGDEIKSKQASNPHFIRSTIPDKIRIKRVFESGKSIKFIEKTDLKPLKEI